MKKFYIFLITIVVGTLSGIFGLNINVYADEGVLEAVENLPEYYIKAVNPGYTVDGVLNVGEMIEIGRRSSDEPKLLAGLALSYTNSSGKEVLLADFPSTFGKLARLSFSNLPARLGASWPKCSMVRRWLLRRGLLNWCLTRK